MISISRPKAAGTLGAAAARLTLLARRLPVLLGACTLAYGLSTAALLWSHMGHGWGFVDLSVYREGGRAALDGAHLYALRFPGALAFTYPPFAALLFAGLTPLSSAALAPLVTAANLVALPAALWFALRLAPLRGGLTPRGRLAGALAASAVALWLEPVWSTLRYGQIDLLIAALVLWDLSRDASARAPGVGIGIASAIKLTPAIFIVYLALTRRGRAAAVAAGTFCATVALAFAALPGDSGAFWGGALLEPGRVGRIENAANQSLRGALARLLHSTNVDATWLCGALVIGAAGLALAVRSARRGDEALGFSLCALTGLLVSPVSWSHHWALAVPALVLFAVRSYARRSIAGLVGCALLAAVAVTHVIWWVPVDHPLHSELRLDPLQLTFADAYVMVGLAVLALAAARDALSTRAALSTRGVRSTRAALLQRVGRGADALETRRSQLEAAPWERAGEQRPMLGHPPVRPLA